MAWTLGTWTSQKQESMLVESGVWSWPAMFKSGSITSCVTWECHSFTSGPQPVAVTLGERWSLLPGDAVGLK